MTPFRPSGKQTPVLFFYWLYIGLGLGSIAVGAYLLAFPRLFVGPSHASDPMQTVVAVILIGFGIFRITLAAYHLRRKARRTK